VPTLPPHFTWDPLLRLALVEDLGTGDITSALVIPKTASGAALLKARQELLVCGTAVAEAVFQAIDPEVEFRVQRRDGERVKPDEVLIELRGRLRSLLAGERTALNFLARLCGVATFTRRFVDAVAETPARIVDTRKTLPGWRTLDKYATAVGGADNHRSSLSDGILIKDNHLAAAGGVTAAARAALQDAPAHLRVQMEVESLEAAREAVEAGIDFLLLDNLNPSELARIARALGERATLEASGGVTLSNVRAVAESGVHRISIGALTHSAPSADLSLEIQSRGVQK